MHLRLLRVARVRALAVRRQVPRADSRAQGGKHVWLGPHLLAGGVRADVRGDGAGIEEQDLPQRQSWRTDQGLFEGKR